MCTIHIMDNGSIIRKNEGRIKIERGNELDSIPIETVDGINIYGKPQLTTQCIEECMKRGISISFFSIYGNYIGGFSANEYVKVSLQRKQSVFNVTNSALELAKRIIEAKINNQMVVLRRYNRTRGLDINSHIKSMKCYKARLQSCNHISQVMGYEGISARVYFSCLGKLVDPDFGFKRRSVNVTIKMYI